MTTFFEDFSASALRVVQITPINELSADKREKVIHLETRHLSSEIEKMSGSMREYGDGMMYANILEDLTNRMNIYALPALAAGAITHKIIDVLLEKAASAVETLDRQGCEVSSAYADRHNRTSLAKAALMLMDAASQNNGYEPASHRIEQYALLNKKFGDMHPAKKAVWELSHP